ncbi:6195_t:CDS:2, partial [Racocetra fulgida]
TNMNKRKFNPSLKIQNNPEDQNLIVPVYVNQKFEFSDEIKNVNDHVSHMEELFGDVVITIDPIYDSTFRYQSDKIQEFTTILRKFNPQTFLN